MNTLKAILLVAAAIAATAIFAAAVALAIDCVCGLDKNRLAVWILCFAAVWLAICYLYLYLKRVRGGRITPYLEKPKKSRFERVYPYLCVTLLAIWWFLPIRAHFIFDPDNVVGDILPERRLQYITRWWDYTPWSEPVVYVDKIDENSAVLRFIGGIDFLISEQHKNKGVIYKTGYVDHPFYHYERVYDITSNPDYWWNQES